MAQPLDERAEHGRRNGARRQGGEAFDGPERRRSERRSGIDRRAAGRGTD